MQNPEVLKAEIDPRREIWDRHRHLSDVVEWEGMFVFFTETQILLFFAESGELQTILVDGKFLEFVLHI